MPGVMEEPDGPGDRRRWYASLHSRAGPTPGVCGWLPWRVVAEQDTAHRGGARDQRQQPVAHDLDTPLFPAWRLASQAAGIVLSVGRSPRPPRSPAPTLPGRARWAMDDRARHLPGQVDLAGLRRSVRAEQEDQLGGTGPRRLLRTRVVVRRL